MKSLGEPKTGVRPAAVDAGDRLSRGGRVIWNDGSEVAASSWSPGALIFKPVASFAETALPRPLLLLPVHRSPPLMLRWEMLLVGGAADAWLSACPTMVIGSSEYLRRWMGGACILRFSSECRTERNSRAPTSDGLIGVIVFLRSPRAGLLTRILLRSSASSRSRLSSSSSISSCSFQAGVTLPSNPAKSPSENTRRRPVVSPGGASSSSASS